MTKDAVTTPARRTPPETLAEYLTGPPKVSQRALAEALGCNQSMISYLRRGLRVPSAGMAVRIHALTGVPLKHLLSGRIDHVAAGKRKKRKRPTARGHPSLSVTP